MEVSYHFLVVHTSYVGRHCNKLLNTVIIVVVGTFATVIIVVVGTFADNSVLEH